MDVPAFVYVALAFAVPFFFYFTSDRKRMAQILDRIPGPLAIPILGNGYMVFNKTRQDLFYFMNELTDKWKPIFRTWNGMKGEVHILEAEHIEVLFGSSTNLEKAPMYEFLHPWLGTGLLTSKGRKWFVHRKAITPTFHFKILENFLNIFVEKSEILVKKLEKESGNKKGFDGYPYITLCTLDIICETAMGTAINAQDNTESPYVSAIYEMSELTVQRIAKPWLGIDLIFYFTDGYKKIKKNLNILHGFTKKVIKERKDVLSKQSKKKKEEVEDEFGKKKRMAFLDLLLEGDTPLTDEEIREEVDTFMFEGHDTTSASLCWTLFLLGHHPEIQERVYEEMEEIFQGSDRPPTMKDLTAMKYLERVIKESLRLYPSVPFIGRKITEEVKVGKYTLPVGCQINVHIYHMHRNPKHFPNPDEFNPDNFLPEVVQKRHPYAYIPFSAGSRNCIGQKFAILEEKTILSYIIRNYKVRSLEKLSEITILAELVIRPEKGLKLALEKRNK